MLFSAELSDFKIVSHVLKSIQFQEFAILRPLNEGLKFTTDELNKSLETSTYIPHTLFSNYQIKGNEEIILKISIKLFTECISSFGDDCPCSLKFLYKNRDAPLSILLKHNEEPITIDAQLKTLNADDFNDISLSEECNLNKIIINGNVLVELLHRLDNSADSLQIVLSPNPPHITFTSSGIAGTSSVHIPRTADSVTIFQCDHDFKATYAFSHIRAMLKTMNFANKIAISTGESGLLGLQLSINMDDKQMFVEHYITAQIDDFDD